MSDEKPMVSNTTNTKQLNRALTKEQLNELQQREDLLKLLDLPQGRRFIWRLMKQCRVFESIFEPNSRIAYNAGMQDVGHFLLAEVERLRPMAISLMMQEAKDNA